MNQNIFLQAIAEGKQFWMQKYTFYGNYTTPQLVSAERAYAKSKVRTADGFCPYLFEIAK